MYTFGTTKKSTTTKTTNNATDISANKTTAQDVRPYINSLNNTNKTNKLNSVNDSSPTLKNNNLIIAKNDDENKRKKVAQKKKDQPSKKLKITLPENCQQNLKVKSFSVIHRYARQSFHKNGSIETPKHYCFDDLGTENNLKILR